VKYVDEFRNQKLIKALSRKIHQITPENPVHIMEVCGTHTRNFFRFGLRKLLPSHIKLLSGPGCPVCVSDNDYIDRALAYASLSNVIIATFGDMLNVPGRESSLAEQRGQGHDIRILYSPWDTLKIARDNPKKTVIFLAVGFETTAPTIALTILKAKEQKLNNLLFLSSLKLIPPAMKSLLKDRRLKLQGFLCPGHVSTIIGSSAYEFIPQKYRIGCCITGFEPLDILEGIYFLLKQVKNKKARVDNQYSRVVKNEGNWRAKRIINKVFGIADARWRGLGVIPKSGLKIRKEFAAFDAQIQIPIRCAIRKSRNYAIRLCKCGDVLKGLIQPRQCPMFAKNCNPENPQGPCMVTSEGTCNVYYQYQ